MNDDLFGAAMTELVKVLEGIRAALEAASNNDVGPLGFDPGRYEFIYAADDEDFEEVSLSVLEADGWFAVGPDAHDSDTIILCRLRQQQPAPPQGRTVSKVADEIMVYYTPDSEPFCPTCGETTLRAQGGHCWHCAICGATFHLGIVADTEPLRKAAEEALAKEAAAQDWRAKYEALQYEYDLYRWYAGERMPRPKGARLRLCSDGTPHCPVCDETMDWVLSPYADDTDNYPRWRCDACGTELKRGEHPSPDELTASIDG